MTRFLKLTCCTGLVAGFLFIAAADVHAQPRSNGNRYRQSVVRPVRPPLPVVRSVTPIYNSGYVPNTFAPSVYPYSMYPSVYPSYYPSYTPYNYPSTYSSYYPSYTPYSYPSVYPSYNYSNYNPYGYGSVYPGFYLGVFGF